MTNWEKKIDINKIFVLQTDQTDHLFPALAP